MNEEKLNRLRKFFLGILDDAEASIRKQAGETIVEVGHPGSTMYLLRSGKVSIELFCGKETVELVPGDLIGLMGIIKDHNYEDTAVAVTNCKLLPIDMNQADLLAWEHPTFVLNLMQVMENRFHQAMELASNTNR